MRCWKSPGHPSFRAAGCKSGGFHNYFHYWKFAGTHIKLYILFIHLVLQFNYSQGYKFEAAKGSDAESGTGRVSNVKLPFPQGCAQSTANLWSLPEPIFRVLLEVTLCGHGWLKYYPRDWIQSPAPLLQEVELISLVQSDHMVSLSRMTCSLPESSHQHKLSGVISKAHVA